jgi:hypothetical protein
MLKLYRPYPLKNSPPGRERKTREKRKKKKRKKPILLRRKDP